MDGYLCDERSQAMRSHGDACAACSRLDVRVRRSLLALQTLPTIEPSADFRRRLHERLALSQMPHRTQVRMPMSAPMRGVRWGLATVVTAASLAFLVLAPPPKTARPYAVRPVPVPVLTSASKPVTAELATMELATAELVASQAEAPVRSAPMFYAAKPMAEDLRLDALPGVPVARRARPELASPGVRLQLASFTGQ